MKPLFPILLIAVAVTAAGCAKHEPPLAAARPVMLAQVVPGSGAETAVFAGEVKPRYESDLAFRIPGKIVIRAVDAGARVSKGQVLARLDPADVGLQAEAARAQVAAAQNEYDFAQAEYQRYQSLLEQKFVSASALDAKRNAMNTNRAKLAQAKANLAVTQNQAAYATLVAPEDGVITSVTAEAGQVVAAGQPVMRHARETEREVAIAVPEARLSELARAEEIVVVLVAEPAEAVSRESARDRARRRSGDAHVRRPRVRRRSRAGAAVGDDGQRRPRGARRAIDEPAAVDVGLPDGGRPACSVGVRSQRRQGLAASGDDRTIPRGRRRDRLRARRGRVGGRDRREQAARRTARAPLRSGRKAVAARCDGEQRLTPRRR